MSEKAELIAHARRMVAKGAPGAAEALAALEGEERSANERLRETFARTGEMLRATFPPDRVPTTSLKLRLPWSTLIADNRKYAPAMGGTMGNPKAKIILTKEYRAAKRRIEEEALRQLGPNVALTVPVAFLARVYEPDRRTRRDIANMTKVVHDALTKIAYADDSLIDDVRWIRMPPDIDAPRVEILIQPL